MKQEISTEELEEYITAAHTHQTVAMMAEEYEDRGVSKKRIVRVCRKLGVKPVSHAEYNKRYILACYHRKTAEQLGKALGLGPVRLGQLCAELGVSPMVPPAEKTNKVSYSENSPGGILSRHREDDAGHWIDETNWTWIDWIAAETARMRKEMSLPASDAGT